MIEGRSLISAAYTGHEFKEEEEELELANPRANVLCPYYL